MGYGYGRSIEEIENTDCADAIAEQIQAQMQAIWDKTMVPNGTGGGGRKTWATLAANTAERSKREGWFTRCIELDAAVSKALAAEDNIALRLSLTRIAPIVNAWLRDLGKTTP